MSWCTQVEKTETPGKIIVVTTKGQIQMAWCWLDDNIPKLFNMYLPKNPTYHPYQQALPIRTNHIETMEAMTTYADALKVKFQRSNTPTDGTTKQFRKPPTCKISHQYLFNPNKFPKMNTMKPRTTATASTTSSVTTEQTTNTSKPNNNAHTVSIGPPPPKFDLEALKQEICNNMKEDLLHMISQQIELLQQQIELLRNEVREHNKDLLKWIDDLVESMRLLSAQMSQLKSSFQSTSPSARGDGRS